MAKGRKGRTFRKKMRGGQEIKPELELELEQKLEQKLTPTYPASVVDISKIRGEALSKPVSSTEPTKENISDHDLYADDVMGGKLRRTRKRRMTKRRRNSRKSRKSKSRRMRRGGTYFDLKNEYNSPFENQPVEDKINRIEKINDNPQVGEINNKPPVHDNITNFSDEYIKLMLENKGKYDYKKANEAPIRL
jgi:hypothetical protein